MGAKKRRRVEPAEELHWGQLELLLDWPEQIEYERIRPVVVFGSSVAERAQETVANYKKRVIRSSLKDASSTVRGRPRTAQSAAQWTWWLIGCSF